MSGKRFENADHALSLIRGRGFASGYASTRRVSKWICFTEHNAKSSSSLSRAYDKDNSQSHRQ